VIDLHLRGRIVAAGSGGRARGGCGRGEGRGQGGLDGGGVVQLDDDVVAVVVGHCCGNGLFDILLLAPF